MNSVLSNPTQTDFSLTLLQKVMDQKRNYELHPQSIKLPTHQLAFISCRADNINTEMNLLIKLDRCCENTSPGGENSYLMNHLRLILSTKFQEVDHRLIG